MDVISRSPLKTVLYFVAGKLLCTIKGTLLLYVTKPVYVEDNLFSGGAQEGRSMDESMDDSGADIPQMSTENTPTSNENDPSKESSSESIPESKGVDEG